MRKISFLLFISLSILSTSSYAVPPFSREIGYGPELIYNLPLNELGIGARAHIPLDNHWIASPQLNYFLPIGQIHELNLNLHIMYIVSPWNRYSPYLTAGPYFNYWINHKESADPRAKALSFAAEIGGGVLKNSGCMRPFAEWRYNAKWSESNLRIGFVLYPNICRNNAKCGTYD